MRNVFTLLLFLLISTSITYSQKADSTNKAMIKLIDGTEIIGYITASDSASVTIKSLSGIVSVIPRKQISSFKTKLAKDNIVDNEYIRKDPADNRVMALPSAVPLKQGEVQFNAMELIFPYLQFGITDFFSIGLGGLPFLASGHGTFLYYLSAKVTPVNFKGAAVSLGGAMLGATQSKVSVGIGYVNGTFGNNLNSFTLGVFMAFSSDEVYNRPVFMIGGQTRLSKSVSLLSENVILFGTEYENYVILPSIGLRFSGEKIAADFGTYAFVTTKDFFYPVPWIGLSYKF